MKDRPKALQAEMCPHGSGTLGIQPFMAKWTLGILDSGGWGVGGLTTFCGRDCIAIACYRATCNNVRAEMKLQPISDITMGAGTGGAGWASAHLGKNQGGHGPPWKF